MIHTNILDLILTDLDDSPAYSEARASFNQTLRALNVNGQALDVDEAAGAMVLAAVQQAFSLGVKWTRQPECLIFHGEPVAN